MQAPRIRRTSIALKRLVGWTLFLVVVGGIYLAYRWAEPSASDLNNRPPSYGTQVSIRLENVPFTAYADGHKAWSLWARNIDMEHGVGSAFSNLQGATLTDIRDGVLYPSSPNGGELTILSPRGSSQPNAPAPPAPTPPEALGPPVATFHASQGRYLPGAQQPLPSDLSGEFFPIWQFRLTGNVDLKTSAGDHLESEALTIVELVNRQTRKAERRMICDSGARITLNGVEITTNQARYNPEDRTVACFGGIHGTFKEGTVQTEQASWSLKDQVIRCPLTSTGVIQGDPFEADNLLLDLKNRTHTANRIHLRLRKIQGDEPKLPHTGGFLLFFGLAPLRRKTMSYRFRFSLKLAGVLIAVALVGILASAAARQTTPKTTPGAKSPVPSSSNPRPGSPPPTKSDPPPAAKSNTATPPPPSTNPPKGDSEFVDIWLNQGHTNEKTGISTAVDYKYIENDTTITGDKVRYDRRNEILDTESNLVLDDPKHHVTGDKAHVDRPKHLLVVTGNVVIVLKPEQEMPSASPNPDKDRQSAEKEKKHGGTITCDKVEDYYRRKFSILSGHLVFKQRFTNDKGQSIERTATAEHAEYDGKKEILHLFGPVDYQDSEGQTSHTEEDVYIGTKEGEETVEFKGKSSHKVKKYDYNDTEDDNKPPTKTDKPNKT